MTSEALSSGAHYRVSRNSTRNGILAPVGLSPGDVHRHAPSLLHSRELLISASFLRTFVPACQDPQSPSVVAPSPILSPLPQSALPGSRRRIERCAGLPADDFVGRQSWDIDPNQLARLPLLWRIPPDDWQVMEVLHSAVYKTHGNGRPGSLRYGPSGAPDRFERCERPAWPDLGIRNEFPRQ